MTTSNQKPYVILASLELDATADNALENAMRVAGGRDNVELHLVHVVVGEAQGSAEAIVRRETQMAAAPERIKEVLDRHLQSGNVSKVSAHVRTASDAAQAILQAAVDVDADLIIVGSHRRRGIQKLLLGSVAERVLKDAHCPVMVALGKDYSHDAPSVKIDPPCPDCLKVRAQTAGKTFWCERHSHDYAAPHVYTPSDRGRNSIMPST